MSSNSIRVRFAPSPTGGLHIGGVRTVLFNYLFAKSNQGKFILRIEDTDQSRFVASAEQYIFDCLDWCGIKPDESVREGGQFAPYRQSERKEIYKKYAEQLIKNGHAYYAFDTPEALTTMRSEFKTEQNPNPQYDKTTRLKMKNSLTISQEETDQLITAGTPYVIRIKVPENETITFTDMIRGSISNDSNLVDDKVLLKADGMPTYHLAVVVDDYLMEISHAFRGEEWLPSAPIHILLWKYLGWENKMPQWAHLPLILKPDGNGKLSKRDGERLGFPVFAMDWQDPTSGETTIGFKEKGFLPEAFLNMLVMLGWNPGTEQEIFSMDELCHIFTIDRVHKSGAKFDYEKAKWYNQQHLQTYSATDLLPLVQPFFDKEGIVTDPTTLLKAIALVKERCQLLSDFVPQARFFFQAPNEIDKDAIAPKWNEEKDTFFSHFASALSNVPDQASALQSLFEAEVSNSGIKKGELMLPLRIMLVGGKFGPGVFEIMEIIGTKAASERIENALRILK